MELTLNNKPLKIKAWEQEFENNDLIKLLKTKTLEEQLENLYCAHQNNIWEEDYGIEFDNEKNFDKSLSDEEVSAVYVKDDVIVAIDAEVFGKPFVFELNKKVNVYFACDEDGPYSKTVCDYVTLQTKLENK